MYFCTVDTIPKDAVFFNVINFDDEKVVKLLCGVDVNAYKLIVEVINMINNQHIESINLSYGVYTIKGKTLSIRYLSTAERVFLLATAGAVSGTNIYR